MSFSVVELLSKPPSTSPSLPSLNSPCPDVSVALFEVADQSNTISVPDVSNTPSVSIRGSSVPAFHDTGQHSMTSLAIRLGAAGVASLGARDGGWLEWKTSHRAVNFPPKCSMSTNITSSRNESRTRGIAKGAE
jgi:hypothetical protein